MYKTLELPDAVSVANFLNCPQRDTHPPIPPNHVISVIWKSHNMVANDSGYYEVVYWDQTCYKPKGVLI